jgi:hypothetical protein
MAPAAYFAKAAKARERGPTAKTVTLSMLHHGVENSEDVREDGEDGGQPGDEDTVRFIACGIRIKMKIRFSGRWKAGGGRRLQDEGVEEVGVGHLCLLMAIRAATTQIPILATKRKRLIQKVRRLICSLVKGV